MKRFASNVASHGFGRSSIRSASMIAAAAPFVMPHFLKPDAVQSGAGRGREPADVGDPVERHRVLGRPAVLDRLRRRSARAPTPPAARSARSCRRPCRSCGSRRPRSAARRRRTGSRARSATATPSTGTCRCGTARACARPMRVGALGREPGEEEAAVERRVVGGDDDLAGDHLAAVLGLHAARVAVVDGGDTRALAHVRAVAARRGRRSRAGTCAGGTPAGRRAARRPPRATAGRVVDELARRARPPAPRPPRRAACRGPPRPRRR